MMKKHVKITIAWLLLTCALLFILSGCDSFTSPVYYPLLDDETAGSFTSSETAHRLSAGDLGLENMEIVAEDATAILYFNPKTTEIALRRKATGMIWYSNPQDRLDGSDPLLNAQFVVTTLNRRDVAKLWNTFDDSVAYGQYKYQKTEQGVTVTYLMGKVLEEKLYPAGMTETRFQELLDQLTSDQDRSYLRRMYGRVDLATITSGQQRDTLKKTFVLLETELGGVMFALKSQLSRLEQKNLTTLLQNAGYTLDTKLADETAVGYAGAADAQENFVFSAAYNLDQGSLTVQIDPSRIKASDKLKISQITVLRNFGAQKPGRPGYLFVPDGSGAIIDTQTARSTVWANYTRKVYGQDLGILRTDRVDYSEQTYLPVFGAFSDQGGFLGVAEQGDGQMSITAGLANQGTNYSYVSPDFTLLSFALVALESSAKNALNLYPRKAVDDPIALRYLFCDCPNASYDDLAVTYRNYLQAAGRLDGQNVQAGLAMAVNAIGAIDEIKSVLGYPVQVTHELTSLAEVLSLGQMMRQAAPSADPVISYTGWQKGGILTDYLRSPRTEPRLGSNSQMTELSSDLKEIGVTLLPVVEPEYCYQASLFSGFSPLNHAIRFITRDTGFKPQHNIANFYMDDNGLKPYIVRPQLVAANTKSYMNRYAAMNMSGISLGAMASEVYSDFRQQDVLSVNDTIGYFQEAFAAARTGGIKVGASGANAYALAGLDYALGLPVTSSNHPMISRSVPFLQMVLSGSVSYTMPALNQDIDAETYLLKAIETGSGVYFDYFADQGSVIMRTRYDQLYGAAGDSIWRKGSDVAAAAADALQPVANHAIISHEQLAEGVFRTTYDNGLAVTVNYNDTAWQTIQAKSYSVARMEG